MIITLLVITIIGICIYNWDKKKQEEYIKSDSFKNHLDTLNKEQDKKQRKTDLQEKNESMLRMANNMGTTIEEVKEDYISDLKKNNIRPEFKDEILEKMLLEKTKESRLFGVKDENTCSAMMIEWFLEYIRSQEIQELDKEFNSRNSLPYTSSDFVSQRWLFDRWEDQDLLTTYEDEIYDVGSLNQTVLVDVLKERGLILSSAHEKKKYEIKKILEERMENSVIETCKANPMINTPLAVIAITEAIGVVSENYKKHFLEGKDEIGLNEFEVIALIEEIKKKVFNKLIEH